MLEKGSDKSIELVGTSLDGEPTSTKDKGLEIWLWALFDEALDIHVGSEACEACSAKLMGECKFRYVTVTNTLCIISRW